MTWAVTRLQEAIVEKLSADATLVSETGDGVEDSRGTKHHIGIVLNEAGAMERSPFIGIRVLETVSAIPNTGRAHIFRSTVAAYVFSKDECLVQRIADRLQYLLTTPEDDYCNGYLNFSNSHIWNYDTEFGMRVPNPAPSGHSKVDESYSEIIEFEVVWTDVPCGEIVEPECQTCEVEYESVYDVICYYDY